MHIQCCLLTVSANANDNGFEFDCRPLKRPSATTISVKNQIFSINIILGIGHIHLASLGFLFVDEIKLKFFVFFCLAKGVDANARNGTLCHSEWNKYVRYLWQFTSCHCWPPSVVPCAAMRGLSKRSDLFSLYIFFAAKGNRTVRINKTTAATSN